MDQKDHNYRNVTHGELRSRTDMKTEASVSHSISVLQLHRPKEAANVFEQALTNPHLILLDGTL